MPLHSERTLIPPVAFYASKEVEDLIKPQSIRLFLRNAIDGNANVTIVENNLNEVCLFFFEDTVVGVAVSYDTQLLCIMTQQEVIDYYRDSMIAHDLLNPRQGV